MKKKYKWLVVYQIPGQITIIGRYVYKANAVKECNKIRESDTTYGKVGYKEYYRVIPANSPLLMAC